MNSTILLWMIQIVLAAVFLIAGGMKVFLPADAFDMPVVLPRPVFLALGVAELLGAVGLLLPWWLGVHRHLTSLAALGLMLIAAGATVATAATEGPGAAVFPMVLVALAAVVAQGRRHDPRSVGITVGTPGGVEHVEKEQHAGNCERAVTK